MMSFGETIKAIRKECLMSQTDFAKVLGVSFSTVNRWENGKALPQLCKIKAISDFCKKKKIAFNPERYV